MTEEQKGNIIIYRSKNGVDSIDVRLEDENVWLSQQQMAALYQSSRTNVVEHIKNIYEEGELNKDSTCRNFRQVRLERKVLNDAGAISSKKTKEKAIQEYKKYKAKTLSNVEKDYLKTIAALEKSAKQKGKA